MARDGDVNGISTILQRLGPPKSSRVVAKINTLDENKVGILHYAARYEQIKLVQLIVFWGGDVNIRGDDGLTPLHFAARFKISSLGKQKTSLYLSRNYNDAMDAGGSTETLDIKEVMGKKIGVL